jgi:hypothetical protein
MESIEFNQIEPVLNEMLANIGGVSSKPDYDSDQLDQEKSVYKLLSDLVESQNKNIAILNKINA